ncbi:ATP-binding protein [Kitasatospora viridis]|uniref:Anti-sigma regulatory factor (Ser/Thr protein kinase) n=1 Tax=Kitasatospora viridis TaxID=281105 RepID=A0A561UMW9_9ACTN|nr:ATP-binding protein [Kitasatospora viridis]TWG00711.1 anti-sigma regulatory factor (Ser/Thr protein kinase) [Kitasatospora viridis]
MPGTPSSPSPSPIPAIPAHWRFPAQLPSVAQARGAIAAALPATCSRQLSFELRLLTSELVTNAIQHGTRHPDDDMIELFFWTADGHHWLAVSDPGAGNPTPPSTVPSPDAIDGRGLFLVDALSDAWGVSKRAVRGKSVIAGIRVSRNSATTDR